MSTAAETLWGDNKPAEITERPASDAAKAIYGDGTAATAEAKATETALNNTYGSAGRAIESAAIERFEMSNEDAQASVKEWTQVFAEHDIAGSDAQQLVDIAVGAADADQSNWASKARSALISEYGDGANRALDDARAFLATQPKLRDYLHATGLGSHPKVVLAVANRARRK